MQAKLIPPDPRHQLSKSLYFKWRISELISALFSNLGIVSSLIDYETGFSNNRTHNNCSEHSTQVFRFITLALTLVSLGFLLQRHWLKVKWYNTRVDRPSQEEDKEHHLKKRKKKQFLSWHLLFEVFILSIFPYPYMNSTLTIIQSQRVNRHDGYDNTVHLCYTVSELFFVFTFVRFAYLLKALFNFTPYQDDHARYYCARYKTKANVRFSIRCMLKTKPSLMIVAFVIPSFLVLGIFLRVFERPYQDVNQLNFSSYLNAVWCCAVTMATIGYGDLYPGTLFGRIIAIACAVWGAFAFSMIVFTLESTLQLTSNQTKAFQSIIRARASAKVIASSLYYNLQKKRHGVSSWQAENVYKKLKKRLSNFKLTIKKLGTDEFVNKSELKSKEKFKKLSLHMMRIEEKLDKVLNLNS